MTNPEYLVSHGRAGAFGRFRAQEPLHCRRGDRVVVRTQLGLELGEVLCPATERHAALLGPTFVGELLRRASPDDEQTAEQMRQRGQQLFDDGRRLIEELHLPLELLDVELLLDGRRATLHQVRSQDCDAGPLLSALSRRHDLEVTLQDLAGPVPEEGDGGCGRPDCGQGHGGCTSCSTGGCSTGCGSAGQAQEVLAYFAELRDQMDRRRRTPLV